MCSDQSGYDRASASAQWPRRLPRLTERMEEHPQAAHHSICGGYRQCLPDPRWF
jgi:hypothetical protein